MRFLACGIRDSQGQAGAGSENLALRDTGFRNFAERDTGFK